MEYKIPEKIVAASIENCIHIVTLYKFLNFIEGEGFSTSFIGSAVPITKLIDAIKKEKPQRIVVSYRLTPEVAKGIFQILKNELEMNDLENIPIILSGTPPVIKAGEEVGIFDFTFSEIEPERIRNYLKRNNSNKLNPQVHSQYLPEYIKEKYPFPLIRHHFGLPSLSKTVSGAKEIAEAGVLDILSIGTDQNSQEFFFQPEKIDLTLEGAGGVPVRKPEDLAAIYSATRCGNYPLLRCYSGTRDLIKWAKMLKETINIAWGAVPLSWYSELDGRSKRPINKAIKENQEAIKWYAENGIPVEINESHQWGLRFTSDVIEVVGGYLSAYNAKKLGVKHYVMQYMLNTPPGISPEKDLAKMIAKMEIVENLHDKNFTSYRMVRTGLASLSQDQDIAKGQLASSITFGMALKPHIVHVVGFSEGDHAATPQDVIESCKIARGVIDNCMLGLPDMLNNTKIIMRKNELLDEAKVLLDAIKTLKVNDKDPLFDPEILAKSIKIGLLDAPLLKGVGCAKGELVTKIKDGACCAINPKTKEVVSEEERIKSLFENSEVEIENKTRVKE